MLTKLKNNFYNKYFYLIFFCFLFGFLFFKTLINYEGNKLVYIGFSLIFNFLIIKLIFSRPTFFEIFFSFLLWLGFWLKFSIFESGILKTSQIFDGRVLCNFDFLNFDKVLIISSISALSILAAIYSSNLFFSRFDFFSKKKKFKLDEKLFYLLFYIFIFFYFSINIINQKFGFYQKGLSSFSQFFYLEKTLIPYLYNIGFGSLICFFIFNLQKIKNNYFYLIILLIIIEGFFSNISIMSRNMILYSSSIFIGYVFLIKQKKKFKNFQINITLGFILIILISILSIYLTNDLREKRYINLKKIEITENSLAKKICLNKDLNNKKFLKNYAIIELFLVRAIGIEGVMATENNKEKLSLKLLLNSLEENSFTNNKSFYEKTFLENTNKRNYINSNQVILPGIIGYLSISGSSFFIFLILFCVTFLLIGLEFFVKSFTQNIILSSFISFVIVWRLINFGYLVTNTIYFLFSIFFTILLIYFLGIILIKNDYKKK